MEPVADAPWHKRGTVVRVGAPRSRRLGCATPSGHAAQEAAAAAPLFIASHFEGSGGEDARGIAAWRSASAPASSTCSRTLEERKRSRSERSPFVRPDDAKRVRCTHEDDQDQDGVDGTERNGAVLDANLVENDSMRRGRRARIDADENGTDPHEEEEGEKEKGDEGEEEAGTPSPPQNEHDGEYGDGSEDSGDRAEIERIRDRANGSPTERARPPPRVRHRHTPCSVSVQLGQEAARLERLCEVTAALARQTELVLQGVRDAMRRLDRMADA
jgi:hypothetical protein